MLIKANISKVNNICYIFIQGRKEKILANKVEAQDFYYGLNHLKEMKDNKVNLIEFTDTNSWFSSILKFLDKAISKLFSIPFYSHRIVSIKNLKTLLKSDKVILVSESTGYSALLMLIFLKFRKTQVILFVMGLYSKKLRFKWSKTIHNLFIKILIFFIDDVLILGKGEYEKAISFHNKKSKIHYFPFCVDTNFWKPAQPIEINQNSEILFIGNDGNRDYEMLINIAKDLKQFNFRFISENSIIDKVHLPNVVVERGKWGSSIITDVDLRNIYARSKIVVLPLKESTQPSGQSVCLQAMSLGVPVIISDTDGFWDKERFLHNESIHFINPNEITNWTKSLEAIHRDNALLSRLSKKGQDLVDQEFSLKNFNSQLLSILNI